MVQAGLSSDGRILGDALGGGDAGAPGAGQARRLSLAFGGLLAATVGLIVLGALVRAHGAGLACPDWPLCFGQWVPRMNLTIGFEWAHRVVAGGVALLFAGLAARTLWHPTTRRVAARPLAAAAALLLAQIALGALTVWELLAPWTVTAHLVTGNAFAVALLWTAAALRDLGAGAPPRPRVAASARRAVFAAAAALGLQLVFGGLVSSRYAGLACPDWPSCSGGLWFPAWSGPVGLHLLHRWTGYGLLALLLVAAFAARRQPGLRGPAWLALALGSAQVVVGVANVLLRIPVEVTGLHSALAAALVLTLSLQVRRAGGV